MTEPEKLENMKKALDALCRVIADRAEDTERMDWMEAFPQEFSRLETSKYATWREAIDEARK